MTTPQSFDDVINAQMDFTTNFHDFAVKNIDRVFDGDPYPLWQKGPEGTDLVPDAVPGIANTETIGGAAPEIVSTVQIPVLSAQYDLYVTDPDVGKITFDFSNINRSENLDVDVVGKVRSTGLWRRIHVEDKKLELCQGIDSENFQSIWVVLSNHRSSRAADGFSPDEAQKIDGDYSVTVGQCDGVRAGISYQYTSSGTLPNSNVDQLYQENASFDLSLDPLEVAPGFPAPYTLVDQGSSFSISTHYTLDSTDESGCRTFTTVDGSGSGTTPVTDPFHPSSIALDAADPLNPFVRGNTAVLSYVLSYDEHGETVFSGPAPNCSNDTSPIDLTGQTQLFTCVPNSGQATLGDGLYGVFQQNGPSRFYKFDCSASNLPSQFGVPGSLSVTGQLFLFDSHA